MGACGHSWQRRVRGPWHRDLQGGFANLCPSYGDGDNHTSPLEQKAQTRGAASHWEGFPCATEFREVDRQSQLLSSAGVAGWLSPPSMAGGGGSLGAGMTFNRYQLFHDPSPHFPSPPKWYLFLLSLPPAPSASANPAALPFRHLPNPSKSLHGPCSVRPPSPTAHLSPAPGILPLSWPPAYPGPPGL